MADLTIIYLPPFFPRWVFCQRCDAEGDWHNWWPYYQEFLHPDDASNDSGGVNVCPAYYRWLCDHSEQLWLRTPKPSPQGESRE
jgi:hypothetical protein